MEMSSTEPNRTIKIGNELFELVDISHYIGFGKRGCFILKPVAKENQDA